MKRTQLFFTALQVPLDFIALIGAAAIAYLIRFSAQAAQVRPIIFDLPMDEYIEISITFALAWLIIFAFSGLYSTRERGAAVEFSRIALACSTGIAFVLAISFFSRELFDSRFIVLAVWLLSIFTVFIFRMLTRAIRRSLLAKGTGATSVIIIGKTKIANTLEEYFKKDPKLGYRVTAHVARFTEETKERILKLKRQGKIDAIILANPNTTREEAHKIKQFSDTEHLSFLYSADMFPGAAITPIVHTLAGQPVIEIPKTPLAGWGAIYKRIFDIIASLILITITLPIQLLTALVLFIESPGNVFFIHKRVGQGGKVYDHFKFRSMVHDAHKFRFDPEFIKKYGNDRDGSPLFKLENDPRITRVGRFIRKYSIDELPEFFLVLSGKLSLVGPRPHLPKEVDSYKPHQKKVLTIKPGISGMAQTSGRADLDFDEEVALDMHYIENWSPWLDLIILVKTPIVVIFSRGAY